MTAGCRKVHGQMQ